MTYLNGNLLFSILSSPDCHQLYVKMDLDFNSHRSLLSPSLRFGSDKSEESRPKDSKLMTFALSPIGFLHLART